MTTPLANGTMYAQKQRGDLHPNICFKFIRSKCKEAPKLSLVESMRFNKQITQLQAMADEYAALGQVAMSEECIEQMTMLLREAAVFSCGYTTVITEKQMSSTRDKISQIGIRGGHYLRETQIKNFARCIPKSAAAKIKKCIDRKLFDDYIILHLDNYGESKSVKKTREEREKDPICFGRLKGSDKYYFICDWVDEMDDLRLKDLVKTLCLKRADMQLKKERYSPVIAKAIQEAEDNADAEEDGTKK
jgi:hypothetical protein